MRNWLLILASLAVTGASANEMFVRSVVPLAETNLPALPWVQDYETFRINKEQLTQFLDSAPLQTPSFKNYLVMTLPTPDGNLARFKVAESPIMTPELQTRIKVKTYKLIGIDDKYATGRISWGINGFSGLITTPNGSYIIDPPALNNRDYMVAYYRKKNFKPRSGFVCLTQDDGFMNFKRGFSLRGGGALTPIGGDSLKTYRLAMNSTGEYTAFHGGVAGGEAAIAVSVNRENQVYNEEFAIHLNMIYVKAWPDANTDPYDNDNGGAMLGQNQTETDNSVGDANYDMGHVFSTGGGGIAALNSVGVSGRKAQGVTGLPQPIGDQFDIDYVAHEMGHQFGGRHTFADCQGNSDGNNAYEPGSGTTIMAYAGICGDDNVQSNSDPYFHIHSVQQIVDWRNNPQSGGTQAANGNQIPTIDAGADYTIPQNTPFKLTASGTDGNNDPLFYCWEQFDFGAAALFRSVNPSASATRFFPKLSTVLAGGTDRWEPWITTDKTLNFRASVRDKRAGGGGIAYDDMVLTVSGAPFQVTAPIGNVAWNGGSQQTITWNVGGGTATNVNILLSLDGGTSYGTGGATMVLANTPNDGSQMIQVPQIATTNGRIIVEAAGNVYYSITSGAISITPTQIPVLTGFTLANASVVGGFNNTGTLTIDFAGAGDQIVDISSDNANAQVPATVTIPGGSLTRNFTITTSAVTTEQTATITAKLRNVTRTAPFQITRDVGPNGLVINPNPVFGGARAVGTVFLTQPAPLGGIVVNMTDNGPELAVNPNVIVASTYQQQNFTILTYVVAAPVVRTVTATRAGHTVMANVTILPYGVESFTIAPSGVVSGNPATGTISLLAPAGPGGLTVNLTPNSPLLQVPATITVPEGQSQLMFPVNTLTTSVEVMRQVSLTYGNQKMTRNLVILPADIASLVVNPKQFKGGTSATATINLNGNAGSNFVVNVSVNGEEVSVPSTVTVPYSKKSANFTVNTQPVASGRTKIITITRNGRTRTFAIVITK